MLAHVLVSAFAELPKSLLQPACRHEKARTVTEGAIRAEEYVLPNHSCLARQHTIIIRLLSLDVKRTRLV